MPCSAEAHAEDDRKVLETVQARNALDALVHSVKKSVAEYGDKIDAGEKTKIEAALKESEDLLKEKDAAKDALEARTEDLGKAAQKLGEIMYAQAQKEAEAATANASASSGSGDGAARGKNEEKVVDAEFTEVKDGKK